MKRVICLILTLCLVGALVVVPAWAVETDTVCVCGCGQSVDQIQWQPWTFTEGNAETGHYYLDGNYTSQTDTITVPAFKNACLDLRGNVYDTENIRTFSLEGALTVMDSVGGGMILTTGKSDTLAGFAYVSSIGELTIHSGTIQFVEKENVVVPAGGLIYVRSGKLNIYGGRIQGGVVRPNATTNAQGGNIYLNDAQMTMSGGLITAGMARANSTEGTKTAYQGGNIYAVNGSALDISGGSVTNGYCDQDGGNIYIASATLHISGSAQIVDGHALRNGGNIQQLSTGVNGVHISGGLITGGVAGGTPVDTTTWDDAKGNFAQTRGSGGGGNLYVRTAKGTLEISGGVMDGDIKVDAIGDLKLSGSPKIGLGKSNGLLLEDSVKADISDLSGGEIYISADHVFTTESENAQQKLSYFRGAVRTEISAEGNALKATQGTTGYCPHCGELVTWTACFWKDVSDFTEETHCYMKGTSLSSETIAAPLVVDMNGMTFGKEHAQQLVAAAGSLTLLDSFGGGQLIGTGSTSGISWGGVLRVNDTVLTLQSGTICRVAPFSASYKGKETKAYIGGVVFGSGAATLNICGGVVRGGIVNQKYSSYAGAFGGNIGLNSVNGIFRMSGGLVLGGKAENVTVDGTVHKGQGGNIYTPGKTEAAVSGGFILDGQAGVGGNVRASVVMDISGGTIAYGEATNGGNIAAARVFTMSDGMIAGGKAADLGGNIYLDSYASVRTVEGGCILGGTAQTGGNIYQAGASGTKGSLEITGALVLRGAAVTAGNIYTTYSAVALNGDCCVYGGTAGENGGNLQCYAAVVTIDGAAVMNGTAGKRGGNIYALGGAVLGVENNSRVTWGYANEYGGNICVASSSTEATLTGGRIYGGNARNAGGNICLLGSPSLGIQDVAIAGGIYCDNGVVSLSGSASVTGGKSYNIYFKGGKLQVSDHWSGEAGVKWSEVSFGFGDVLDEAYGACGTFSGNLYYDGISAKPGILPDNGNMVIATTALCNTDGSYSWYCDNASAVAAYDEETAYMKLMTDAPVILSGGLYTIDLFGQSVSVLGEGTVTCVDSANDSYDAAACGSAVIEGPTLSKSAVATVEGKQYVRIGEGSAYTFHRMNLAITNVSLRPSCAGLYYQAAWECDSVLQQQISQYGIGVSLVDMPGADLQSDPDTIYTSSETAENARCSALIENIFSVDSAADENRQRGEMPIYAAAYVRFFDGTVFTSNGLEIEDDVCYSLYSFLRTADQKILSDPIGWRLAEKQLQEFYSNWQNQGAGDWLFSAIQTPVAPSEDNVMKILMIGQSHAQDTVWLLYDVLKAERPDEAFLVVDVYRSTNLDEHVQNIKNNAPLYDYYENSNGTVVHTPNVTITEAIMRENWDLIVFNEAAWNQTQEEHYHDGDFEFMINHIRQYADPGYKLGYNATWAQPVTNQLYTADRRPAPPSFRNQFTSYFGGDRLAHFARISQMMETYIETNDAFDIVFHSGTAIQYASETHGVPEADPARSYDLYRDYTHLSEFGRLMVAYQWYAQIYGLEEITEVNVSLIRQQMRATSREQAFGDLAITDTHKEAIIASVNYALQHPNQAPEQVVRQEAILEPIG